MTQRNCPSCSRRLEAVALKGGAIFCCAHCSVAWSPGAGKPAGSATKTLSRADLVCPDCNDRALISVGAIAGNAQWRCIACHGRLVRVSAAAVSPPPRAPSGDGGTVEFAVEIIGSIAEVILGLA